MKILLIYEGVYPESRGGLERWFSVLAAGLVKRGHSVTYLNNQNVNVIRDGVVYISISDEEWIYKSDGVRSIKSTLKSALSIYLKIRKLDYDCVYASAVPILVVPFISAAQLRSKTKTYIEWVEIWPLKYWIRYAGNIAGFIGWLVQLIAIQCGDFSATFTLRANTALRHRSLSNKNRHVLLRGMCPDQRPSDEIFLANERTDIVSLGRMVGEKQPFLALEIVKKFVDHGWQGRYWIIGTGPLQKEIELKIEQLNLVGTARVLVDAPDTVVSQRLRDSFVLLHPSRREGYGLAAVEAAYLGTPTLLVNYPDNATVDLAITPELICETDEIDEILGRLIFAYDHQIGIRARLKVWVDDAHVNRSLESSIDQISSLVMEKK